MPFAADQIVLLDRLDDALHGAAKPTVALFARIIAGCNRIPVLGGADHADRIIRLAEDGAWIDAALTLIALELPAWRVRRLVYENGEWLCSLSLQPNLPAALDDSVDVVHEALPLAVLRGLVEARRRCAAAEPTAPAVAQSRLAPPHTATIVCCDNFA